jgi:drug/metabolite transporter (DMT)-like permease
LVNYQVPIWAVLIGTLVLSEALPGHFISALAIILAGLAISQFYDRWRNKKTV